MPFITKDDFPASVHADILDALTRSNDNVITDNASRTIDEMKAYLNGRYNTTAIFNAQGDSRNKYMLRLAISITLYYIFLVHNPRKMTQNIVEEYERSIEALEKIQKGSLNPEGLPLPDNPDNSNSGNGGPVQWGSMPAMGSDW
jgi:phage gp36-like protein